MKTLFKQSLVLLIGAGSVFANVIGYAAGVNKSPAINNGASITQSIERLRHQIMSTSIANKQDTYQRMFQFDQFLNSALKSNNQETISSLQKAKRQVNQATGNQIAFALKGFSCPLSPKSNNIIDVSAVPDMNSDSDRCNAYAASTDKLVRNLNKSVIAHDNLSLFLAGNKAAIDTSSGDNALNAGLLIGLNAYNNPKLAAYFTEYFTQSYVSLADGLDLSALKNTLDAHKGGQKDWLESHVYNNSVYQKYQADIRTLLTQQSVVADNLHYLSNERKKVAGLGTKAGMSTQDASPLQVEQFPLTQTVNNPAWYKQITKASPTAIAREQLLLTAIAVKQRDKQRELQERILLTLTTLVAQNNQNKQQTLKTEVNDVNKLFSESEDED